MAVVLARAALIGVAGGALAVTLAILLSSLMPIGPARLAKIHLGISIDPLVLALGWLLLASLSVACAVLPARRASRMQLPSERTVRSDIQPSTVAATVARSPLPLVAGMGIRFGLDPGHGRKAVPIVGTIVSTALAVGAVTAALTFGSSLEQLITSPRQQGWNWTFSSAIRTAPRTKRPGRDEFCPTRPLCRGLFGYRHSGRRRPGECRDRRQDGGFPSGL